MVPSKFYCSEPFLYFILFPYHLFVLGSTLSQVYHHEIHLLFNFIYFVAIIGKLSVENVEISKNFKFILSQEGSYNSLVFLEFTFNKKFL